MARTAATPRQSPKTSPPANTEAGAKERPDVLILRSPDGTVRKIGRGLKPTGRGLSEQDKAFWEEILGPQEWQD